MRITGGYLKSRKIDSPKGENVRPTLSQIRESIFSVLYGMIDFVDSSFLDVFAGSGIMGFEAVSRGFSFVDFIEKDKKTFFLLKENAKKLGLNSEIHIGDSLKILIRLKKKYDVIYLDPPYAGGLYDSVLVIIREYQLLNDNGIVVVEHPVDLEINFSDFFIKKQKKYSDKLITFLTIKP